MILVVGPSSSGKTLLLKQLEETSKTLEKKARRKDKEQDGTITELGSIRSFTESREKVPATVPTIGSNFCTLNFGKRKGLDLREVGGSMGPVWKSYYKDASKVVYVIDISNPFQVSSSTVHLLEMLNAKDLRNVPFLLLLNKIDNFSTVSHVEMKSLLMLDSIVERSTQPITVIEASAKYSSGLPEVIDWITKDS